MNYLFRENLDEDPILIEGEEFVHGIKSLRLREGDSIFIVDGRGALVEASITKIGKRSASCTSQSRRHAPNPIPFHLNMVVSPTKNTSRWEWMLEKCTEIGCSEFTPIICSRSERRQLKLDRSRRIIKSAMKQSLKTFLPHINDLIAFGSMIESESKGQRFICTGSADQHLLDVLGNETDIEVLIGPEGDFTPEEMEWAQSMGYQSVHLGRHRLRTETAAVVANTLVAGHFRY